MQYLSREMVQHPIILVPGIGGSILVKRGEVHKPFLRHKVVHNRWLNLTPFIPDSLTKWKKDMAYDIVRNDAGTIIGLKGYDETGIEAHDVGGINGIRNLVGEFDLLPPSQQRALDEMYYYRYFDKMSDHFIMRGYKERSSLFGIPYDFRLVLDPKYRHDLFDTFQRVIEYSHKTNKKQTAIVVAHSLGVMMMKWFMKTHVSPEWIKEHIHLFVAISPPLGGAVFALRAVISGDHYIPLQHEKTTDVLRRNTGIIACLPNEYGFSDRDHLWVSEEDVITLKDFEKLAKNNVAFEIYRDLFVPHKDDIFAHVPVKTYVIMSRDQRTPTGYSSPKLSYPTDVRFELGDSVLTNRSLDAFYYSFDPLRTRVYTFEGSSHTALIRDKRVIDLIEHNTYDTLIL